MSDVSTFAKARTRAQNEYDVLLKELTSLKVAHAELCAASVEFDALTAPQQQSSPSE